jgi:hypothetical protein
MIIELPSGEISGGEKLTELKNSSRVNFGLLFCSVWARRTDAHVRTIATKKTVLRKTVLWIRIRVPGGK